LPLLDEDEKSMDGVVHSSKVQQMKISLHANAGDEIKNCATVQTD
jgi:hypothetical protein